MFRVVYSRLSKYGNLDSLNDFTKVVADLSHIPLLGPLF